MADLRQLSREEFLQFMRGIAPEGTNASIDDLPTSVTPATRAALLSTSKALEPAISPDLMSEAGRRMGIRPGTFLETEKGAPASVRFRLGLDENQLNQFKLLTRLYGPGNVDLSDEGRFVLRNQPSASGGIEDVLVDPVGMESGDVSQIGSQIIPMIAGAVGARFGGRLGQSGLTKAASAVTGMAVGQETVGAGQDAIVRALRDDPVNFSEIAKHRATMAVADEIFGFAAAGGAKALSKMLEGAAGVAGISTGSTATKEAQQQLAQRTGVSYPLSPGQASENRVLLRLESMIGERIGSAGPIDRMRQAQQGAEDELRRVFLGMPRAMTDEELAAALPRADIVGQQGLTRLGSEALRLEGDVAKAAQAVQRTGTAEAQALAGVDLASPQSITEIGRAARSRVQADFDQFKATMGERYEEFLSRPKIRARVVSGDSLAAAVAKAEAALTPKAVREGVEESLDVFVPAKFRSFTEQLKALRGTSVSINDLKQIRTSIDNAVAEGVSIPGTDIKQFTSLRRIVDDKIEEALKGMEDSSLLPAWKQLSTDYAAGMSRFDRTGIREMLVKEGERGAVGNTEIAESILGNSPRALDRYNDFKAFFGASSSEFQALQAGARQNILFGSLADLTGYIDGAILRRRLSDVRPEIAEELFGTTKQELHRIGEALSKAQGKLDTAELAKLAESKSLTAAAIPDLVRAEQTRATAYNNKLIRAAAQGSLDAEKIKPSEFVRHVTSMDPSDAARVMGVLSDQPELLQDIRRIAVEEILSRAKAGTPGQELLSSSKLLDAMGKEAHQRETWQLILGKDTVDSLKTLADVTGSREIASTTFKGGGRLAGASDLTRVLMQGEVGALKEAASRFLLAFLYSGPLRKSVTNLATSQDRSRFLNGVIASTPFAEAVLERFGSDGGFLVMSALRDTVEPLQRRDLIIQGQLQPDASFDPRSLSKEEFQQWLQNNLRQ